MLKAMMGKVGYIFFLSEPGTVRAR